MKYIKHLVECHCILPIFKKSTKIIYHKFPVFSTLDENDNLKEKYVKCNNCNALHLVKEVNKSEILLGKEGFDSYVITKEDIEFNLNSENLNHISNILNTNDVDITVWEHVNHVYENNIEDSIIVLNKEDGVNNFIYKYLVLKDGKFKIKKEIQQKVI